MPVFALPPPVFALFTLRRYVVRAGVTLVTLQA